VLLLLLLLPPWLFELLLPPLSVLLPKSPVGVELLHATAAAPMHDAIPMKATSR
jgi:hypothetical protein